MKNRLSILVLVAVLALMAASGASAKRVHHYAGAQRAAHHSLVKQANKSADQKSLRRSHRGGF